MQVQYLHQWLDGKASPVLIAEGDTTICASGLSVLVAEWKSTTSASCNWWQPPPVQVECLHSWKKGNTIIARSKGQDARCKGQLAHPGAEDQSSTPVFRPILHFHMSLLSQALLLLMYFQWTLHSSLWHHHPFSLYRYSHLTQHSSLVSSWQRPLGWNVLLLSIYQQLCIAQQVNFHYQNLILDFMWGLKSGTHPISWGCYWGVSFYT